MSGRSKFNFNDALFFGEIYEKEYLSRLRWFEKNYEKVYESKPPDTVPRKAKVLYDELVKWRIEDNKNAPRYVVPHSLPPIPRPDPSVQILPPMRPVPPSELALLKEGSSEFLRARYRTNPDDRYYFPATTNWNYGWLVGHLPVQSGATKKYSRKNIIQATFLRRNGVHPENPAYRQPTSHNLDFPSI